MLFIEDIDVNRFFYFSEEYTVCSIELTVGTLYDK